ncbi:MAG: DnaJ domain-containing protein, partial [Candidatus Acidiferrales bacterium]
MKDYYAILGLDSDASTESVKLAYRRLAREAHPDRLGDKDSAAQALASSRMAELNEAYAVLSDSARRKEYDKEFRAWQAGEQVEAPLAPAPVAEPAVPAPPRARARPAADMHFSVVRQFSTQLQNELFSDKRTFRWRVQPLEGFDW